MSIAGEFGNGYGEYASERAEDRRLYRRAVGLEAELAEALARAEKAERERDEARRMYLCEILVSPLVRRHEADIRWGPGTGAHLFPEEPTE